MNRDTTEYFFDTFKWNSDSKTADEYIIIKNNVRFSVLSDRLLRVEIDNEGIFTDAPTQTVINRNFSKPKIRVVEDDNVVIIMTTKTIYRYDTAAKK